MTINVAHRGDSGDCPENTLAAFRSALALGVDMIELDVWWTADQALAVTHDPTVDRCTNGVGVLEQMTWQEIRSLDAGAWQGQEFAGEPVPSLGEALDTIGPPTQINMHLKTCSDDPAFERQVYEEIIRAGARERALLVHDFWPSLQRLRDLDGALEPCLLPRGETSDWREYISDSLSRGLRVLQPGRDMMSAEFCEAVREHGLQANVFYADTEEDMRQYIAWGIGGILTNFPTRLRAVLEAL